MLVSKSAVSASAGMLSGPCSLPMSQWFNGLVELLLGRDITGNRLVTFSWLDIHWIEWSWSVTIGILTIVMLTFILRTLLLPCAPL